MTGKVNVSLISTRLSSPLSSELLHSLNALKNDITPSTVNDTMEANLPLVSDVHGHITVNYTENPELMEPMVQIVQKALNNDSSLTVNGTSVDMKSVKSKLHGWASSDPEKIIIGASQAAVVLAGLFRAFGNDAYAYAGGLLIAYMASHGSKVSQAVFSSIWNQLTTVATTYLTASYMLDALVQKGHDVYEYFTYYPKKGYKFLQSIFGGYDEEEPDLLLAKQTKVKKKDFTTNESDDSHSWFGSIGKGVKKYIKTEDNFQLPTHKPVITLADSFDRLQAAAKKIPKKDSFNISKALWGLGKVAGTYALNQLWPGLGQATNAAITWYNSPSVPQDVPVPFGPEPAPALTVPKPVPLKASADEIHIMDETMYTAKEEESIAEHGFHIPPETVFHPAPPIPVPFEIVEDKYLNSQYTPQKPISIDECRVEIDGPWFNRIPFLDDKVERPMVDLDNPETIALLNTFTDFNKLVPMTFIGGYIDTYTHLISCYEFGCGVTNIKTAVSLLYFYYIEQDDCPQWLREANDFYVKKFRLKLPKKNTSRWTYSDRQYAMEFLDGITLRYLSRIDEKLSDLDAYANALQLNIYEISPIDVTRYGPTSGISLHVWHDGTDIMALIPKTKS